MENFGVMAFTMATPALSIAVMGLIYVHGRLNNLERKLKEFDVLPEEFDSIPKEFKSVKELDRVFLSQD